MRGTIDRERRIDTVLVSDPLVGTFINGKFRVIEAIGQGGMGAVYRAEQLPLGRTVAIKVLRNRPGVSDVDPAFQRRFFLEASLCAKLSHANIVTIYDYGRIEGVSEEAYFMAMELLDGETLHARLRRSGGQLSLADSLSIALEIARGLREAHRTGIVHRDLKPGNVMLVPDAEAGEKVKILDFGLVKQLEGGDREDLTQEGSFLGSPKYMSPEQIDRADVDHRADLYSLGVIMFQCLCGRVPYDGPSSMQILLAHVASPIPTMRERNPLSDVPPDVEALVRKLLAKSPSDRHASAEDLVRALRTMREQLGLATRATQQSQDQTTTDAMPPDPSGSLVAASMTEPRASGAPEMPPARSRVVAAVLVMAGLLALGSAGVVMVRRSRAATRSVSEATVAAPSAPVIRIESTPGGAVVSELGRNIGITPLTLPVDADLTGVRHFTLALEGYQPYALDHAASPHGATLTASLVPAPPAVPAVAATQTDAGSLATGDLPGGQRVIRHVPRVGTRPVTTPAGSTGNPGTTPNAHPLDIMTER